MWTKMFFFFKKKTKFILPRKQNTETQINKWNVTIVWGKKVSIYFSTVLMIETYKFKLIFVKNIYCIYTIF